MSLSIKKFLVLFDIDGTLISAGKSGYYALETAIVEVLNSPKGLEGIRLDGNTDLMAIKQVCIRDGRDFPSEEEWRNFKKRYLEILRKEIVGKGFVMTGVKELLSALKEISVVEMGLVTGNIREGAKIKLERFQLDSFFDFGAFGCEHADRSQLVGLALKRAVEKSGVEFSPKNVTLIGDTVHDVRACKPWNVACLAVATGSTKESELQEAGADMVLPNLSDWKKVFAFLTRNQIFI